MHASFVVTGTSDARFELLKLAVIHESDHGAQGNQSTPVGECWIPVAALLSTELDETGVDERQWEEDALHSNTGLDGPRSDDCATGSGDGGGFVGWGGVILRAATRFVAAREVVRHQRWHPAARPATVTVRVR